MSRTGWIMLGAIACATQSSAAQDGNDGLDRMVSRLLPLARNVSGQFDDLARRVRRDSGTARADVTVYRFWRRPWVVTRRLDAMRDEEILAAINPDGGDAHAQVRKGIPIERARAAHDSLVRILAAGGVKPWLGEGATYFALSAEHLQRRVGCCVSTAMREYLAMEQESQERPPVADGTLMLPLDSVINRMVRAEQYLASYPSSVAFAAVTFERDRYLAWVLYGIDNTPAFHFRTREIVPEYQRAMERVASERAAHHSGRKAQAMLDLLKQTAYRRTAAVDSVISRGWSELRPPPQ